MPPRPPLEGSAPPALTPAEIAAAADRLAIVARCPIARLERTALRPGLHSEPCAPGLHRVQCVSDDHRVLFDAPLPDALLDPQTVYAMEATRKRKSAEFAAACAACRACQRYEPAPITRGPLTLTR